MRSYIYKTRQDICVFFHNFAKAAYMYKEIDWEFRVITF